jgi:hypothetical protein
METNDRIKELQAKIALYEQDGVAKLYYSLNRKAGEMADLMNSNNLKNLDIDDPKSKTFDRLKVIWNDAASIATAVKQLGEIAGVTGDEEKDTKPKRRITSPESIADVLGNTAGQLT